jgi:hypothetical protein
MNTALTSWQADSAAQLANLDDELQAALATLRALRAQAARIQHRIAVGVERITAEIYHQCEEPADANDNLLLQLENLPSICADEVHGALDAIGDLRKQTAVARRAIAGVGREMVARAA